MEAESTQTDMMFAKNIQILQRIGKGCQGEVYSAINKLTNQQFAVKIIPTNFEDEKQKQRIEFQIKSNYLLSNQLKSCYFPYFYGYSIESNKINLIFEKCECNALSAIRKKMNYNERYNFVIVLLFDMLKALKQLQQKNIIHRDIKAENILIKNGQFKLGDLGLSRIQSHGSLLTADVGNLMSRSPQFYTGKYDCKTDVWSLGINIFYFLEGVLPFDEETALFFNKPTQFKKRIEEKEFYIDFQPTGKKSKDIMSPIHQIVQKMLEIEPISRHSASQLLRDYFQILYDQRIAKDRQQRIKYLLTNYLNSKNEKNKSNYFLILLLLIEEYTRFDHKIQKWKNAEETHKLKPIFLSKLSMYGFLNYIKGLLQAEQKSDALLIEFGQFIDATLAEWQKQLQYCKLDSTPRMLNEHQFRNFYMMSLKSIKIGKQEAFKLIPTIISLTEQLNNSTIEKSVHSLWKIPIELKNMI